MRRAGNGELVDRLKAFGALDQIFEQIDAGEVSLSGDDGLLKEALERGLEMELTDPVSYERAIRMRRCSRIHARAPSHTVSSEVGEVELAVPQYPQRHLHPAAAAPRGRGGSAAWMR